MHTGTLAVGKTVFSAIFVWESIKAQVRIVGQGRVQVPDREDWTEVTQLAGRSLDPSSALKAGALDSGKSDEHRSHRIDLVGRDVLSQLGVDCFDATRDGFKGFLTAIG